MAATKSSRGKFDDWETTFAVCWVGINTQTYQPGIEDDTSCQVMKNALANGGILNENTSPNPTGLHKQGYNYFCYH